MEYKATKIKGAVRLHGNEDRALGMVREFEEQAARMGLKSIFKEAAKCAEEFGQELDLEHEQEMKKEVRRVEELPITHNCWTRRAIRAALANASIQSQKTHTSGEGEVRCGLCGKAPESVAHILSGCSALAQGKYLSRHDASLKVLFYELLYDEGVIDEIPPWYSPDKPKPVYESENVKAYRDVPIYADQQEVRCNRVDARIVNHMCQRVVTLEMSCPLVNNRTRKDEEKTLKYGPLLWELRQQLPGYEVEQYNIIMDALGGWSRELDVMMRELVGGRSTDVLRKMQRAVLSGTLNIARTFKMVCKKEEEKGNRLLTTLSGLFVSNSKENIKIELTDLDPGWEIKGANVKVISIKTAWNSPENSVNFPLCVFKVSHVDLTKQQFFCEITVSHDHDSANTEMVAFFEQRRGVGVKQPKKHKGNPVKPPHGKSTQLKYISRFLSHTLTRGSRDEW
ncbi:hypothetical protein AWC38_SpisGene6490 [Stylophora pistillata]|uniref:Uncharacterized protein n=1 Tax=Stylophora pistillata TaxID=50429 RepID=A0A2B4SI05_STYPI|nr:hypothetical protein AWC38_SpisGene6490 [Stylophora pistillata]